MGPFRKGHRECKGFYGVYRLVQGLGLSDYDRIWGLSRGNGKENGSHYLGFRVWGYSPS